MSYLRKKAFTVLRRNFILTFPVVERVNKLLLFSRTKIVLRSQQIHNKSLKQETIF